MTIINGKIPLVNLTALSVGGFLQANAAYWFEQWRIAARNAGYDLTITSIADAYREYAVQERIFRQRYTPVYTQYAAGKVDRRLWLNSYWYRKPGYAAAAVPGTSNHGRGLAVDIKDVGGFTSKFYKWLKATGADYGFSNTEGASVNEAWHWVHNGKAVPPKPLPETNTPTPTPETVEFLMTLSHDEQVELLRRVRNLDVQTTGADGQVPSVASRIIHIESQVSGLPDALAALPNSTLMTPVSGVDPSTGLIQTHPAADWLTVMAFRVAEGASPEVVVSAIPESIAEAVLDLLAERIGR